jgi:hypothetical protein
MGLLLVGRSVAEKADPTECLKACSLAYRLCIQQGISADECNKRYDNCKKNCNK